MRVIAGAAKGRRLEGPGSSGTRPMTDRAKEALFSSLGDRVVNARVLDLYAGTGSLGLEAMSRGASDSVFVENARNALHVLQRNVESVGLGGMVVGSEVAAHLMTENGAFDLVFIDPPYSTPLASIKDILEQLGPKVTEGGIVVLHRRTGGEKPRGPEGWRLLEPRRYGDTELWRFEKEEL